MSNLFKSFAIVAMSVFPSVAAALDDFYDHHIALQVSDNDPDTFTKVLNVAKNTSVAMEERGETVEIRIVTFRRGLHLLREDTSTELERVRSYGESMPHVTFAACGNTMANMTKKEGKEPPIVEVAEKVPSGVEELIRLAEEGWIVLRP